MARNPRRALSHAAVMLRQGPLRRIRQGVALCELACNPGVPIMQSFAVGLSQGGVRPLFMDHYGVRYHDHQGYRTMVEVTAEARVAYALSWGISPAEQEMIEEELEKPLGICLASRSPCLYYCNNCKNAPTVSATAKLGSYVDPCGASSWATCPDLLD